MTFDPTESRAAVPATGEENWRARKGMSRLVVELPSAVVTGAVRRANRRRIPLAALVEEALRAALSAEGVAVMLAALAIAVSGCHASAETKRTGCTMPAELLCRFD